ncbi:MAG: TlpA disulfide reductase family protein [Bacteroidota bacterium]
MKKLNSTILTFVMTFIITYTLKAQSMPWEGGDADLLAEIDQHWNAVMDKDGDESNEAQQFRGEKADLLLDLYHENKQDKASMSALFHAMATYLRKKDYIALMDQFEALEIEEENWRMIYLFYQRAIYKHGDYDSRMKRLDGLLEKVENKTQFIQLRYDKGFLAYNEGDFETAEANLKKIVDEARLEEVLGKTASRVKSYLGAIENLQIGNQASDFEAVDLNGKTIKLSDFKDKVIMLDFWATWCGPCVQEIPDMKALKEKYGDQLVIISISLDKKEEKLRSFIKAKDLNWTHVYAPEGRQNELVKTYCGFGLPTYYIIDKNGKIHYNYHSRKDGKSFAEVIENVL